MPSSYISLTIHVIFSTKDRAPALGSRIIRETHEYLGGTLKGLGAMPLLIGGTEDHVHLLIGIKGNHSVSDLVRETKKASTKWLKEKGYEHFRWQDGFAAFSVSPERIENVRKYIGRQDEHHRTKTYMDKLVELLTFAQIPFEAKLLE